MVIKRRELVRDFDKLESDSLLARNFQLRSQITDLVLVVQIQSTGELVFSVIDIYLNLGILSPEYDGIKLKDFSPLLRFGFSDDDIANFLDLYKKYYGFNAVVQLCSEVENGLVFLSSLVKFLRCYGKDYFNEWYGMYLHGISLVDVPAFEKEDVPLLYITDLDFRCDSENLCGVVGDLYVLQFSTGVVKVGKSKNGERRIKQHITECEKYLVTVTNCYIKHNSRISENVLIDFCKKHGNLFYGKEYFKDIQFEQVKEFLTLSVW